MSERLKILVETGVICQQSKEACVYMLEELLKEINTKNEAKYEMFEIHVAAAIDRIISKIPLANIEKNMESSITKKSFLLAKKYLDKTCDKFDMEYSYIETLFIAAYIEMFVNNN